MRCWIEDGLIIIYVHECYNYEWSLERIRDNDSALEFLNHVAEKSWCGVSLIIELASLIKSELGIVPDLENVSNFKPYGHRAQILLSEAFSYLSR